MRKIYYIAQIKELIINATMYKAFEKVSLEVLTSYYDSLEEAEEAITKHGSKYTSYTIITEYYNND